MMQLNYERSFLKDVKLLHNRKIQNKLKKVLIQMEQADSLNSMVHVKKLKGYESYYRLRIADYRLGFSVDHQEITLIRFMHRKTIYRGFP